MTAFVEAQSLSAITDVAANPPSNPYLRSQPETLRRLLLYISRVPGSKDLILSTLKPQRKNVTAEDVASSLYYIHLDTPDDSMLLESLTAVVEEEEPRSSENAELSTIAQTVVPSLPLDDEPPPQLPPRPTEAPALSRSITRKPVPPKRSHHPESDGAKRLQGPRPLATPRSRRIELSNGESIPDLSFEYFEDKQDDDGKAEDALSKHFTVTLIRRDPTSGQQWNIGKVSSEPIDERNLSRSPTAGGPSAMTFIRLETPGYDKFLRRGSATAGSPPTHVDGECALPAFERQVHPEWPSVRERTFKHQHSESTHRTSQLPPSSPVHATCNLPVSSPRWERSRPKAYRFSSPWNGQCEFYTSTSGRSVKCRHSIVPPNVAPANAISQDIPVVALVSELRFNLPRGALFGSSGSSGHNKDIKQATMAKFHHIRGKLSSSEKGFVHHRPALPPRPPAEEDDDSDDDDDRMDLSLGQEKAGGGNRGKRAKMGKLIVYEEGLKMLDLVVAANIGIWWRSWEP